MTFPFYISMELIFDLTKHHYFLQLIVWKVKILHKQHQILNRNQVRKNNDIIYKQTILLFCYMNFLLFLIIQ